MPRPASSFVVPFAIALAVIGLAVPGCSSKEATPDPAATDAGLGEDEDAPYVPPTSFTAFVGDFGDASWVVLFAKAPMDAVSAAYGEAVGAEVTRGVPVTATDENGYGPSGTVARVKGSEWVQICHRVGFWEEFDAAALAETLNAPVLLFHGEDNSGAVMLERHAPGEPRRMILTAEDRDHQRALAEEHSLHGPPADAQIVESYDAALVAEGAAPVRFMIPAPGPGQELPDGAGGVLAGAAEAAKLERVDATPVGL